ncbi:MAG: flippase-like domain-containing protein [Bacteroidales bacterium]|nr:flippase-like domain-containing protein [Bacteroidales bacterium]
MTKTLARTVLPLVLGVGVGVWLFNKDVDAETLRSITFDGHTLLWLVVALLFVAGRDFGLSWRFHTIADGDITWLRAIRTDLMCAFTSAITPSVVGGSALAIFYLNREGISVGRATSLTLATLFLDELFFVVCCPLIALLVPWADLFGNIMTEDSGEAMFMGGVQIVFWLVYAGICIWTAVLYFAIIARPATAGRFLARLATLPVFRRFAKRIGSMAANMAATSEWIKGRPAKWWGKVFAATVISWFSRYFVVNALFAAFVPGASQLLVFARQCVVWVVLMVSPTPGGSGISEWLFANYYGDLIGGIGIATILALLWRVFSYYIYLIAGCALLPGYFKKS